jgi:hypothetical protein
MRRIALTPLVVGISMVTGCVAPGVVASTQLPGGARRAYTTERAAASGTVYDLIERTRPRFLRSAGGSQFEATVYLDGMRIGGVEELRGIAAMSVIKIEFLSAVQATGRFGTSARSAPAIVLTSA